MRFEPGAIVLKTPALNYRRFCTFLSHRKMTVQIEKRWTDDFDKEIWSLCKLLV